MKQNQSGLSLVEVMIGVGLLGFMAAMTMTPMVQFKKTEKMAELQSSIDLDHDIAVQKARNITYLKRKLGIDSKDATTFDKAKADCFSQKGTSCDSKYTKGMHVVETTAPVGNAKSGATKSVSEISFDITCAAIACDGVEIKVQTQESTVGATSAATDKIQVRKRDFNYKIGASSLADRAEIDFSGCSGKFVTGVGFKSLDGKCLPMAGTTDCSGNNDRPMMTFNKSAMGAGDCQATAATTCSSYGYATAGNFSSDPVCVVPAPPTTTITGTTTTTVTSTTTTTTSSSTTTTTVPPGAAPAVGCSYSLAQTPPLPVLTDSGINLSVPFGAAWTCTATFGQSVSSAEMALCQTGVSATMASNCPVLADPTKLTNGWNQGDNGNWTGAGTSYSRGLAPFQTIADLTWYTSLKAANGPSTAGDNSVDLFFKIADLKTNQNSNLVTIKFLPPSCGPDAQVSCSVQPACDKGGGVYANAGSASTVNVDVLINGVSPNGLGATGTLTALNTSLKPGGPVYQVVNAAVSLPITCTDQSPAVPLWIAGAPATPAAACTLRQILPSTDPKCAPAGTPTCTGGKLSSVDVRKGSCAQSGYESNHTPLPVGITTNVSVLDVINPGMSQCPATLNPGEYCLDGAVGEPDYCGPGPGGVYGANFCLPSIAGICGGSVKIVGQCSDNVNDLTCPDGEKPQCTQQCPGTPIRYQSCTCVADPTCNPPTGCIQDFDCGTQPFAIEAAKGCPAGQVWSNAIAKGYIAAPFVPSHPDQWYCKMGVDAWSPPQSDRGFCVPDPGVCAGCACYRGTQNGLTTFFEATELEQLPPVTCAPNSSCAITKCKKETQDLFGNVANGSSTQCFYESECSDTSICSGKVIPPACWQVAGSAPTGVVEPAECELPSGLSACTVGTPAATASCLKTDGSLATGVPIQCAADPTACIKPYTPCPSCSLVSTPPGGGNAWSGGCYKKVDCFVAGTKITMANGQKKNIEEIQVGELVQTFDEDSGQMINSPVEKTFHHEAKNSELFTMHFSNGGQVTSNGIHRMYVTSLNNYYTAEQIYQMWQSGMKVKLVGESGDAIEVLKITTERKFVPTYNLHILSPYDQPGQRSMLGHNYFANGILAHNTKGEEAMCEIVSTQPLEGGGCPTQPAWNTPESLAAISSGVSVEFDVKPPQYSIVFHGTADRMKAWQDAMGFCPQDKAAKCWFPVESTLVVGKSQNCSTTVEDTQDFSGTGLTNGFASQTDCASAVSSAVASSAFTACQGGSVPQFKDLCISKAPITGQTCTGGNLYLGGTDCWYKGKIKWPGWGGGWKVGQCANPSDNGVDNAIECTWETLQTGYKVQSGQYASMDGVPDGPICENGVWVRHGVCGSKNGRSDLTGPPTERELCAVAEGRPTLVTSGNDYNWTCIGGLGGRTVSCSAKKASTAMCPADTTRVSKCPGFLPLTGTPVCGSAGPEPYCVCNSDANTSNPTYWGINEPEKACPIPGGVCSGTANWTDSATGGSCSVSYSQNLDGVTCSAMEISNGASKIRGFTVTSANGGTARVNCSANCPLSGSTIANDWVETAVANLSCPGSGSTTSTTLGPQGCLMPTGMSGDSGLSWAQTLNDGEGLSTGIDIVDVKTVRDCFWNGVAGAFYNHGQILPVMSPSTGDLTNFRSGSGQIRCDNGAWVANGSLPCL